jgi:2,3-dihydroxybenzoate-AMP ligase
VLSGCTPYPKEFADRYLQQGYWRPHNLGDLLKESAREFSGRVAVSDASRRLSYAELDQLSDRLALHLLRHGLQPRDVVILQLPNTWEFGVIFFALMKVGVIPVMCLLPHRNTELAYFARLTSSKGYFVAPSVRGFDYIAMAREIRPEAPTLQSIVALGEGSQSGVSYLAPWLEEPIEGEAASGRLAHFRPDPFDVAFFLLSGGTTGIPKLIPRTHADYIHHAQQCTRALQWDSQVVFLNVIPAAHNFPLGSPGLVGAVSVGASVAMCPSTAPEAIFETIQRERGTFLAVSPALLISLLNSPARPGYDLGSLRFVCAGGQKMLPELVDRAYATWPQVTMGHAFGMAEGLVNLTRPDDPREVIRETQGRPVSPGDEIRIVDENGRDLPVGEVGELITRGPYTIRGYYRAEEHNQAAFTADGFYRTGDMVRMHPTGNLVVEGRKKDMINRGGEKISAEEVENLILAHEHVHMAAVVAMPDPLMGEKSCAFIIPRPGHSLTLEQLCGFLESRKIARFKLPERLEVVESFPLTSVGKVSKKDLRAQIAARLESEHRE